MFSSQRTQQLKVISFSASIWSSKKKTHTHKQFSHYSVELSASNPPESYFAWNFVRFMCLSSMFLYFSITIWSLSLIWNSIDLYEVMWTSFKFFTTNPKNCCHFVHSHSNPYLKVNLNPILFASLFWNYHYCWPYQELYARQRFRCDQSTSACWSVHPDRIISTLFFLCFSNMQRIN